MARYTPEFIAVRQRPTAHIRDPRAVQALRSRRDDRYDDPRDCIGDGTFEVRIANDIIEEHPDHPINVNFNYGPVHVHQPSCNCSDPSSPYCAYPRGFPNGPGASAASRRNTLPYSYPSDHPQSRNYSRNPTPGTGGGQPRSILRVRTAARSPSPPPGGSNRTTTTTTRTLLVSPSQGSSSTDLDDPLYDPRTTTTTTGRGGANRRTSTGVFTWGMCEGCLISRELVSADYCAECEYFVSCGGRRSPGFGLPRGPGAFSGVRDLDRDRDRDRDRPGGGGVRYVSTSTRAEAEAAAAAAASRRELRERRRELDRERERVRELERELEREKVRDLEREIDRERERARERERRERKDGGLSGRERGVRWVREANPPRERRGGYQGGMTDRVYYSDSDGDSW